MTKDGDDRTAFYVKGAEIALAEAKRTGATVALLKSRSPSCGVGRIHDGTFTGGMTEGDGIAAELLKENGIAVYTENELSKLL